MTTILYAPVFEVENTWPGAIIISVGKAPEVPNALLEVPEDCIVPKFLPIADTPDWSVTETPAQLRPKVALPGADDLIKLITILTFCPVLLV